MHKKIIILTFSLLIFNQLYSQKLGIGAQFGDPTGLTVRINNNHGMNYDLLAAWNVNDYFFINFHGLWENALVEDLHLHYFYGPGIFAGFRDRGRWNDEDVYLGFSGSLGLNVYIQRFEIFAQVTPRLVLAPGTAGDIGGGIGGRFYLN